MGDDVGIFILGNFDLLLCEEGAGEVASKKIGSLVDDIRLHCRKDIIGGLSWRKSQT